MQCNQWKQWGVLCCLAIAAPAPAGVSISHSGSLPMELGSKMVLVAKRDGIGKTMPMSVNGILGGNATVGTVNALTGEYRAPEAMPAGGAVLVTARWKGWPPATASLSISFKPKTVPPPPPPAGTAPVIGDCGVFPDTAIFNTRIDDLVRFPADSRSAGWISSIGSSRALHMDFGRNDNPANYSTYYGIPYNVVDGTASTTDWPQVSFAPAVAGGETGWPDESDCAANDGSHGITRDCTALSVANRRFPYPNDSLLKAENGACNDPNQCGDRHVLVVEKGACRLWESYYSYKTVGLWHALSTAAWDLTSNAMRPKTWTSADAAGLPVTPLLMRADEASSGEIRHAFRVTFQDSVLDRNYVWPAMHGAGSSTPAGIPFGSVMRLRSDFVIPSSWTTQAKAVATAMQRYGVYVADIGSNSYLTGEPSASWNDATISQLQQIRMSSFEFVNLQAITGNSKFSGTSFQASW
jgi:hypothetical protein